MRTYLLRVIEVWRSITLEKARVRSEVADTINTQPVYQAISALQDGKLPSGWARCCQTISKGLKISRKSLVDRGYEALLDKLPGPRVKDEQGNVVDKANAGRHIYGKNGLPVDVVAQHFGFRSADESGRRPAARRGSARSSSRRRSSARMRERHPDALLDGSIADRADEALAGPEKGSLAGARGGRPLRRPRAARTPPRARSCATWPSARSAACRSSSCGPTSTRPPPRASKRAFEGRGARGSTRRPSSPSQQQELLTARAWHAAALESREGMPESIRELP